MSMGGAVESMLRNLTAAVATEVFIYAILAVFLVALVLGFTRRHDRFLEMAPNLLTSLGILGTFVGIVIGLLDFDTNNIDESIGDLLEGLKTAFVTSLVGMLASIALKAADAWKFAPMREAQPTNESVTAGHLLKALERQDIHLLQLTKAIAGSEEGTLIGQFKLLRSDIADNVAGQLKQLRTDLSEFRTNSAKQQQEFEGRLFEQLRNFAEMMSKSATEAVIEALRQVIVDFNRHLVEQFGDNFKALDQSVQKLVVWQAEYRGHIEAVQQRIDATLSAIDRTATATEAISQSLGNANDSITAISTQCERIPGTMEDLKQVLMVNQHQIGELQRHLQAFIEAREKAVQAVPEIKQRMEQLAAELAGSVEKIRTSMHEGALEFGRSIDRTTTAVTEMAHAVTGGSEKLTQDLDDAAKQISKSMSDALARLADTTSQLPAQLRAIVKDFGDETQASIQKVMLGMRESVTSNMREVGQEVQQANRTTLRDTQAAISESAGAMLKSVDAQVREAAKRAESSVNQQLDLINQSLERELNVVFRELGSALTTISRKIAEDFERNNRR
jgi:uncharacterized protein Yka (UPF0111/DUF47 family)/phage-related protein